MTAATQTEPATATSTTRAARRGRLVVVAATAVVLDLAAKVAASRWLADRDVDLPGPLDLRLVHNSGVAFGVGRAAPPPVMVAVALGVTAFVAVTAWRGRFAGALGPGLVLGGAAANIVDRLEAGSVVDMLHLGWWPTFNLADVSITGGAVVLLWSEWRTGGDRSGPVLGPPRPSILRS